MNINETIGENELADLKFRYRNDPTVLRIIEALQAERRERDAAAKQTQADFADLNLGES